MRAVSPLLPLLGLLLTALLLTAEEARAHGGNFRSGAPQGPGIDSPDLGPRVRSAPTTEHTGWLPEEWETWWRLNCGALLPDKVAVRGRAIGTHSAGPFGVGAALTGGLTQWGRRIEQGARNTALPLLLELLDPSRPQDEAIVAAGLVALGRIARDAEPVALLRRYAARQDLRDETRESAVLGLGLLRRTREGLQQDVATLSEVRSFLLALFDDEEASTRVRAFAAYALGLLADQPYPADPFERDGRHVCQALWQRLGTPYASGELPVALLTALGMQPRAGVAPSVMEALRAVARDQAFRGRRWDPLRRSHALSAYARLQGPGWLPLVLWALRGTHQHVAVRSSAAIALALRAPDLGDEDRAAAALAVVRALPHEPSWFVEGLEQISLAFLLREDLDAGGTQPVLDLHIDRYLRREALQGQTMTRPYAALGLGLAVRDVAPATKAAAEAVTEARRALLLGLRHGRGSDGLLAAYAVGLGLAGADGAYGDLLEILGDRKRGTPLRAACAVALGQIGRDTPELQQALDAAAGERVSPLVHGAAVRALAMLASADAGPDLLHQLATTRSRYAVAVVAGALGRLGDPAAAQALAALARDKVEAMDVRVMAVVALGLIFDPEPKPSRVLMTTNSNYPSRTPSLTQMFNIM